MDDDLPQTSLLDDLLHSKPVIRNSFTDVPINSDAFCNQETPNKCAKEVLDLKRQLMVVRSVPVPQPNTELPVSAAQAGALYRQFKEKHAGQPILPVFRQLFARILLNKYHLITSTDYPRLAYYTRELVESGSYDVVTQTNALRVLQAHLPADQFNQLAQAAAITASRYEPMQQRYVDQTIASLNKADDDTLFLSATVRKKIAEQVHQENLSIQAAIRQLRAFQKQPVSWAGARRRKRSAKGFWRTFLWTINLLITVSASGKRRE